MSMFTVTGRVINVFTDQDRQGQDGELIKGKPRVQILGDIPLSNGEIRRDMITLTVDRRSDYETLADSLISVPLGFFSPAKGQIFYFIPKGGKPILI